MRRRARGRLALLHRQEGQCLQGKDEALEEPSEDDRAQDDDPAADDGPPQAGAQEDRASRDGSQEDGSSQDDPPYTRASKDGEEETGPARPALGRRRRLEPAGATPPALPARVRSFARTPASGRVSSKTKLLLPSGASTLPASSTARHCTV